MAQRDLVSISAAQKGTRNSTLNRAAFSLGQIIADGGLDADEVERLLLDRATDVGLGEREARATIASQQRLHDVAASSPCRYRRSHRRCRRPDRPPT